jgi:hypothetical protein
VGCIGSYSRLTEDIDVAIGWTQKPEDQAQQSGLTGTVAAQEAKDCPSGHDEIDPVDGDPLAKAAGKSRTGYCDISHGRPS